MKADESGGALVKRGGGNGQGAKEVDRMEGREVVVGAGEGLEPPVYIEDIDLLNSKRIWS